MLSFSEVLKFAKQYNLPVENERAVLVEYLQSEILDSLFEMPVNLHFIGGTCLRLLYDFPRFSEDLDFDNFNLRQEDFEKLVNDLKKSLALKGFEVEFRVTFKGAYHCYFKFNKLLFENELSPYREQKILIRLDTVEQKIKVKREYKFFNRYGVTREIATNPIETIYAQKILAMLNRKTAKGRDFFDFMICQGKTEPDFSYLKQAAGIEGWQDIKKLADKRCKDINFKALAGDVEKFLFNRRDIDKVINFKKYFDQIVSGKII